MSDPTYGRIDPDIQRIVDEMDPPGIGERVAWENNFQARRDAARLIPKIDSDGRMEPCEHVGSHTSDAPVLPVGTPTAPKLRRNAVSAAAPVKSSGYEGQARRLSPGQSPSSSTTATGWAQPVPWWMHVIGALVLAAVFISIVWWAVR